MTDVKGGREEEEVEEKGEWMNIDRRISNTLLSMTNFQKSNICGNKIISWEICLHVNRIEIFRRKNTKQKK